MVLSAVFVALQIKFSLSSKILRTLGSMPKTSTHALSTSRKHTTGFLVKSFGECCGCAVLTTACYWPSSHCIPAQKFVFVWGELTYDRSPLVLDSDKGACCHPVPDSGGDKGTEPRAPTMFVCLAICATCASACHLAIFSEKSLFADAIIGRPNSIISLEEYLILLRNNYHTYWFPERRSGI